MRSSRSRSRCRSRCCLGAAGMRSRGAGRRALDAVCSRAGAWRPLAAGVLWYPSRMPARAEDTASLLSAGPAFEQLGRAELEPVAAVAVPRRFEAGRGRLPRGRRLDTCYVVRSGHARAIRQHADGRQITLATFGPGDIFGELAMFDDERRSATVEALDELEHARDPRRRHAPADARAPRDRGQARDLARAAAARGQRAPARQSFQTVQSRVAAVLAQLVEQARARAPASATCWSPPRRPTSPSSPAPRASPPAASSPCSSGPGVISQGRGRLTVHDPGAAAAMSTEREVSYGGVVVRGREVIVIVPRGAAACSAAEGRPERRREPGGDRRARGARGDRRHGGRRDRLGDVATPTGAAGGGSTRPSTSTSASTCRATPPTTTTRSTTPAGCRSRRRAPAQLSGRARDDRARAVDPRCGASRVPPRCRC